MKKILILHRYPLKQVVATNASFEEFLEELSRKNYKIFYLTYKDKSGFKKKIKNLIYVNIPLSFDRGNNLDKIVKTAIWTGLAPLYVKYLQNIHKLDLVYCDDSAPYYGFLSKLISPKSKVIIRLGGLQSAHVWADDRPDWFEKSLNIEKYMWKKVDGIVAISEAYKKFIVKQGVSAKKISIVRESINLKNADFSDVVVPKTGKIMFHGSIIKSKGLEVLLDAFKIFNKKYPTTKLVIAGGGTHEEVIKEYTKRKNVKNVTFTGWFGHERLARLMRDIQFGVITRSKNMANNFVVSAGMLEYWAYKKPVIVPDLDAFKEVIEDGKNGIFYKTDNSKDLAEKMEYLYENQEFYSKMAMQGLSTANSVFNHKKVALDLVESLESYSF